MFIPKIPAQRLFLKGSQPNNLTNRFSSVKLRIESPAFALPPLFLDVGEGAWEAPVSALNSPEGQASLGAYGRAWVPSEKLLEPGGYSPQWSVEGTQDEQSTTAEGLRFGRGSQDAAGSTGSRLASGQTGNNSERGTDGQSDPGIDPREQQGVGPNRRLSLEEVSNLRPEQLQALQAPQRTPIASTRLAVDLPLPEAPVFPAISAVAPENLVEVPVAASQADKPLPPSPPQEKPTEAVLDSPNLVRDVESVAPMQPAPLTSVAPSGNALEKVEIKTEATVREEAPEGIPSLTEEPNREQSDLPAPAFTSPGVPDQGSPSDDSGNALGESIEEERLDDSAVVPSAFSAMATQLQGDPATPAPRRRGRPPKNRTQSQEANPFAVPDFVAVGQVVQTVAPDTVSLNQSPEPAQLAQEEAENKTVLAGSLEPEQDSRPADQSEVLATDDADTVAPSSDLDPVQNIAVAAATEPRPEVPTQPAEETSQEGTEAMADGASEPGATSEPAQSENDTQSLAELAVDLDDAPVARPARKAKAPVRVLSEDEVRSNLPSAQSERYREMLASRAENAQDLPPMRLDPESIPANRSLLERATDNIAALQLLSTPGLAEDSLDESQKITLARYSGWMGIVPKLNADKEKMEPEWALIRDQLVACVGAANLKGTLLAGNFQTPMDPRLSKVLWEGASQMGFRGGAVLLPDVGSGAILGVQPSSAFLEETRRIVSEPDSTMARITRLLYPDAIVREGDIASLDVRADSASLVMGIAPIGAAQSTTSTDAATNYFSSTKAGFYLIDGLRKLQPGGVEIFLAPTGFMDTDTPAAALQRRYVAKQARLIDAVRIPEQSGLGGTHGAMDLIILQKRDTLLGATEIVPAGLDVTDDTDKGFPEWTRVSGAKIAGMEDFSISYNRHYLRQPQKILGAVSVEDHPQRGKIATFKADDRDILEEISRLMRSLPAEIMPEPSIAVSGLYAPAPTETLNLNDYVSQRTPSGEITLQRVVSFELGLAKTEPVELDAGQSARVLAMLDMASRVTDLTWAQVQEGVEDNVLDSMRSDLNVRYDAFRKQFGFLNSRTNSRLMSNDSRWARLMSLEVDYKPAVSKIKSEETGLPVSKETANKSPLLLYRTQFPHDEDVLAETPVDALNLSLSNKGALDWAYIESVLPPEGWTLQSIGDALGEAIAIEPATGLWETSDAVLSGDVVTKIEECRRLIADGSPEFADLQEQNKEVIQPEVTQSAIRRTLERLEAVRPERIPFHRIAVSPGAGWIPPSVVHAFVEYLSGAKIANGKVAYKESIAKWSFSQDINKSITEAGRIYTTMDMPFDRALMAVFNNKPVTISRSADGKTKRDESATGLARARTDAIERAWASWIGQDPERCALLEEEYNKKVNRYVARTFDGSMLKLPGISDTVELRPHQLNFVMRTIRSGNTLGDHAGGAGKTYAAIAAAMELNRLGLSRRPYLVVPDNLVGQWTTAAMTLYPQARVLSGSGNEMSNKADRERFFLRATHGDQQITIVGKNLFRSLPNDPSFEVKMMEEELTDIREIQTDLSNDIDLNRRQKARDIATLERNARRLAFRIKTLIERQQTDSATLSQSTIRTLGVDTVFLDESHEDKNVPYVTSLTNIVGMGDPAGSASALKMFMLIREVQTNYPDLSRGAVYLTATPLSNTLAEMHMLMRVMIPSRLKAMGMWQFDAWARSFTEITSEPGFTFTGDYKEITALSKFRNLPELMELYHSFADVISKERVNTLLKEAGKTTVAEPRLEGDAPTIVLCGMTPQQREIIGYEIARTEDGTPIYNQGSLLWGIANLRGALPVPVPTKPGEEPRFSRPNVLSMISALAKVGLHHDAYLTAPGIPVELSETALREQEEALREALARAAEEAGAWGHEDLEGEPDGDHLPTKLDQVHKNMMLKYRQWDSEKGVQLIMLDSSTPKKPITQKSTEETKAVADAVKYLDEYEEMTSPDAAQIQQAHDARTLLGAYDPDELAQLLAIERGEAEKISRWSAYNVMRDRLIADGIPPQEIEFIHDHQTTKKQNALFARVRSGDVRFLFGSTMKLGTGTDVQNRLVALHHVDAPLRASDVEQRNWRIQRQGNEILEKLGEDKFRISIFYYVTQRGFDVGLWQMLMRKEAFTKQIREYSRGGPREIQDPAHQGLDAAAVQAQASNNELLKDRTRAVTEIKRIDDLLDGVRKNKQMAERYVALDRENIKLYKQIAPALNAAAEVAKKVVEDVSARGADIRKRYAQAEEAYEQARADHRAERERRASETKAAKANKLPDPFLDAPPLESPSREAMDVIAREGIYDYQEHGSLDPVQRLTGSELGERLLRRLLPAATNLSMGGPFPLGYLFGLEVTAHRSENQFAYSSSSFDGFKIEVKPPAMMTADGVLDLSPARRSIRVYPETIFNASNQGRASVARNLYSAIVDMQSAGAENEKDIARLQNRINQAEAMTSNSGSEESEVLLQKIPKLNQVVEMATLGLRLGLRLWSKMPEKMRSVIERVENPTGAAPTPRMLEMAMAARRNLEEITHVMEFLPTMIGSNPDEKPQALALALESLENPARPSQPTQLTQAEPLLPTRVVDSVQPESATSPAVPPQNDVRQEEGSSSEKKPDDPAFDLESTTFDF